MTALLVIDMQAGLFSSPTKRHDAEGVVERINILIGAVRTSRGRIIFIQHNGPAGDALEPGAPGWDLLPALDREASDMVIRKEACDAFYRTSLLAALRSLGVERLIVTGCCTDFCVDTTIRSAASKDFQIIVAADGHTTADRPHLDAAAIIKHHNYMWENLILPGRPVRVEPTAAILNSL